LSLAQNIAQLFDENNSKCEQNHKLLFIPRIGVAIWYLNQGTLIDGERLGTVGLLLKVKKKQTFATSKVADDNKLVLGGQLY